MVMSCGYLLKPRLVGGFEEILVKADF